MNASRIQAQLRLASAGFLLILTVVSCGQRASMTGNPGSGASGLSRNRNSQEASEERHFTMAYTKPTGLDVGTAFGSITVTADPSLTDIAVTAKVQARGDTIEEAKTNLARIKIRTERRADDTVEIRAEFPKESGFGGGCSFDVRLPGAQGVHAVTANGAVNLKGLAGKAEVQTSFGSITVTDQQGPVQAHTANGAIHVQRIGGPVVAETSFGNVTIREVDGKLKITNLNGAVNVAQVRESVEITTSFGAVTVKEAVGAVQVRSANGKIMVEKAKGNVRATTSFGAVEVREAGGEADLESRNGPITYVAAKGNSNRFEIRDSFGNVEVRLPSSSAGKVLAKTSFGSVRVDGPRAALSVSGDKQQKEIVLSEAGAESRITTANGSVQVHLD